MDSMRELNTPGKKSRDYRIRVSRENECTGWWGDGTFESRERRHWNWGEVTGMG